MARFNCMHRLVVRDTQTSSDQWLRKELKVQLV
jgi:hypothetical protein